MCYTITEEKIVVFEKETWHVNVWRRFYDETFTLQANSAKNSVFIIETTYPMFMNDEETENLTGYKEAQDYWLLLFCDTILVKKKLKWYCSLDGLWRAFCKWTWTTWP